MVAPSSPVGNDVSAGPPLKLHSSAGWKVFEGPSRTCTEHKSLWNMATYDFELTHRPLESLFMFGLNAGSLLFPFLIGYLVGSKLSPKADCVMLKNSVSAWFSSVSTFI